MCTGDAWASAVTRVMFYNGGIVSPVPVIFFVSYMLLAAIVLINIIIAVLLDEFLTTMSKSRNEIEAEEVLDDNPSLEGHSLDPLMAVLAQFQSSTDLLESIKGIYIRLDEDGSGGIGLCTCGVYALREIPASDGSHMSVQACRRMSAETRPL